MIVATVERSHHGTAIVGAGIAAAAGIQTGPAIQILYSSNKASLYHGLAGGVQYLWRPILPPAALPSQNEAQISSG